MIYKLLVKQPVQSTMNIDAICKLRSNMYENLQVKAASMYLKVGNARCVFTLGHLYIK